jgi:hypothetical protein
MVWFVLGTLLSLPLSIVANVVTPRLSRMWSAQAEKRAKGAALHDLGLRAKGEYFAQRTDELAVDFTFRLAGLVAQGVIFVVFVTVASAALVAAVATDQGEGLPDIVTVALVPFMVAAFYVGFRRIGREVQAMGKSARRCRAPKEANG